MSKYVSRLLYIIDFLYLALATGFVLTLFGWLVSVVIGGTFYQWVTQNQYFFLDFGKYYSFAQMSFGPDRFQLYDQDVQWRWYQQSMAPAKLVQPMYSEYPPYQGAMFLPLSLVPLPYAYLLWLLISVGSACGVIYWLARKYGGQRKISSVACAVGTLATQSALWATLLGQLNWLMVTLVGLLFVGLKTHRHLMNGITLAVMSLKPHYAVFFAISTCLTRAHWRSFLYFVAAMGVLAVISVATVGFENVLRYPYIVLYGHATGTVDGASVSGYNRDLAFLVGIVRLGGLITGANLVGPNLILLFAAMFGLAYVWNRHKDETQLPWLLSATMLTFLVLNPHSHLHDCVILGVAAAITMPTVSLRGIMSIADPLHRFWCCVLYFYPIVCWIGFQSTGKDSLFRTLFFLFANMLLLALAVMILRRKPIAPTIDAA